MERDVEFGGNADLHSRVFVKSAIHHHLPSGHPSSESSVASPLPALSELQSKISAGLEMPVLSSEILDE